MKLDTLKEAVKMSTSKLSTYRFLKKIVIVSWIYGNLCIGFALIGNYINAIDLAAIAATAGAFNGIELGLSALIKKAEKADTEK